MAGCVLMVGAAVLGAVPAAGCGRKHTCSNTEILLLQLNAAFVHYESLMNL